MLQQAVYAEDRPGLRWPLLGINVLGWILTLGGLICSGLPLVGVTGAALPYLGGLSVLAGVGALLTPRWARSLRYSMAFGIRVYQDSIQVGGLRGRDRDLQRGTWPPQKLPAGSPEAVFICPWQAANGVYLITERPAVKRIRRDLRECRLGTDGTMSPLGVFDEAASLAKALLVVSVDPRLTESEPREFSDARGRYGPIRPVRSPTWVAPIRDPGALRDALQQLPRAPPVHDHLPPGRQFEIS